MKNQSLSNDMYLARVAWVEMPRQGAQLNIVLYRRDFSFKDVRAQKFPRTDILKTLTAGRK